MYEDIDSLKNEILALHRKLAAAELEATNFKQRYESANSKYLAKEKELMELKYSTTPILTSMMSVRQLINKGYKLWNLPNYTTIYLIPLAELENLDVDMGVISIAGTPSQVRNMDLDTRGGMLAYGVLAL